MRVRGCSDGEGTLDGASTISSSGYTGNTSHPTPEPRTYRRARSVPTFWVPAGREPATWPAAL